MEMTKQLGTLVEEATSDSHTQPPLAIYDKVLALINSRVDMPKHTVNAVSKRLSIKNKKVLFYCFDLLEYLSFRCELSLYSHISTKEFLLKTSGLLMSQDIDNAVQTKILQTVKCWEELFRPHEDLLPMFFQFYAGLLRKEFPMQKDYVSPHRPHDFKIQKPKKEQKRSEEEKSRPARERVEPSKSQQQTFESIREKIILTNEIIDNANPADSIKSNEVLIEMIEQLKGCEKRINQTINENPNEKIMELALAANDDIFITYRRFRDLQKNRKPEPFILTELASDVAKEKEVKQQKKIQDSFKKAKPIDEFQKFNEKPSQGKVQQKPKEINIMDIACQPVASKPAQKEPFDLINLTTDTMEKPESGNLFDLLGSSNQAPKTEQVPVGNVSYSPSNAFMESNNYFAYGQNMQSNQFGQNSFQSGVPSNITLSQPEGSALGNIGLNSNFQTENDIQKYDGRSLFEKLTGFASDIKEN